MTLSLTGCQQRTLALITRCDLNDCRPTATLTRTVGGQAKPRALAALCDFSVRVKKPVCSTPARFDPDIGTSLVSPQGLEMTKLDVHKVCQQPFSVTVILTET